MALETAPSPLTPTPPLAAVPPVAPVPLAQQRADPTAAQPPAAAPAPGGTPDPSQTVESATVSAERPKEEPFTAEGYARKYRGALERSAVVDEKEKNLKTPEMDQPVRKKDQYTNPIEAWGSIAMLAAATGSLFTRAPLTTALNSAAGAMNAMHAQDEAQAKLHYDEWKEASDAAIKKYQYQNEAFKSALETLEKDRAAGWAEVSAYSAAYGHKLMADAHAAQDKAAAHRLHNSDVLTQLALDKNTVRTEQMNTFREQLKKLRQDPAFVKASPQQQNEMIAQITPGDMAPPETIKLLATKAIKTGGSLFGVPAQMKPRVLAEMGRQTALLHAKGTTDEQIIADQGSYKSDQAALTVLKKVNRMAGQYEHTVEKNMDLVMKKAPKGAPPNLGPWLNSWVQSGKLEFGNTNIPPYAAAIVTVADSYAKVMSGSTGAGGTTEGYRLQALKLINENMPLGGVKKVFEVMKSEMHNKIASGFEQERGVRREMANGMFDTPEDVGVALQAGQIDEDDAHDILVEQFGMEK